MINNMIAAATPHFATHRRAPRRCTPQRHTSLRFSPPRNTPPRTAAPRTAAQLCEMPRAAPQLNATHERNNQCANVK
jgi:hypothetical protein